MPGIDWRELYASNRAAIERARGTSIELPTTRRAPTRSARGIPSLPRAVRTPGAWQERTFTVAGRTRRALVHPPAAIDHATAVPLVCMLHGCTQDAATIAAATRMNEAADRHGFLAVYPQQERGENPQGCWNWFLPEHQRRGDGEPASIAGIVRELIGTTSPWTIDTRRIFVAGFSAGGAMAAVLAATYPDLFAALAVHSGLAYRSATSMGAAFNAMARGGDAAGHSTTARPVSTMVIHGTDDATVAAVNADQVVEQSLAAHRRAAPETCELDIARPTKTSREEVGGGHAYHRHRWTDRHGTLTHELLKVDGLGHAWSGGSPGGSYTDPRGPDATEAIWRFFTLATAHVPTG
jgi:poly(hydroxyalkanoate) depolymerase family esterase